MIKRFLIFEWDSSSKSKKTKIWRVTEADSHFVLGSIIWVSKWKTYVYCPGFPIQLKPTHLREITNFIEEENKLQRQNWRKTNG